MKITYRILIITYSDYNFLSLAYKYKVYPFGTTLFSASDGGHKFLCIIIWDVLHGLKSLSLI